MPVATESFGDKYLTMRLAHRCAKGSLGVLADTQTACQRHARKHHGGAAIQAVLMEAEESDDQDSEGIGERAPSAEGEPAVLTRPCEEVEAAQDEVSLGPWWIMWTHHRYQCVTSGWVQQEAGSSRGDFPVFDSPRSGKRRRTVAGACRPLGKMFFDSVCLSLRRPAGCSLAQRIVRIRG